MYGDQGDSESEKEVGKLLLNREFVDKGRSSPRDAAVIGFP